jgi:hypothetical protein
MDRSSANSTLTSSTFEVGPKTTIGEIQAALKRLHPALFPAAAPAPALDFDHTTLADPALLVGRTRLFGERVSCRAT